MRKIALVLFLVAAAAFAGQKKRVIPYEAPMIEAPVLNPTPVKPLPQPDWSQVNPTVGTSTTLTGFYDYQSNGGAVEQIRVNPANGNIHVTYMLADDSTAAGLNNARRVAYAFSTDGGSSWNNFNNIRVPNARAGFPSIDLGRGPYDGAAILASHDNASLSKIYVDFPEGGGAFTEIPSPTPLGTGDEPIWPFVAGASDGSVVMTASTSTAATVHYAHTVDFVSWSWTQMVGPNQSGGRYPTISNGTGRVGILANTSNGASGNWWTESTDNGSTWSTPADIFGIRITPTDTLNSYVHCDFVYDGDTPLYVFDEASTINDTVDIVFWSQATGFRVAVPYDATKYFFDPINQRFHALNLGWPSIGLSGNTIVVAFQAFQKDVDSTATHRYQYSDVWFTQSNDGGMTWTPSENLTNTALLDERYPSISKWNAPGEANIVWTSKNKSGLYAFPGLADTVRATQVFYKKVLTGVKPTGEITTGFKLNQNYPNPFNPATKIDYSIQKSGLVTIKVFDVLGKEVTTLLNEVLQPGTYQTTFDGQKFASGIYYYRMTASGYTNTRKMMLLK